MAFLAFKYFFSPSPQHLALSPVLGRSIRVYLNPSLPQPHKLHQALGTKLQLDGTQDHPEPPFFLNSGPILAILTTPWRAGTLARRYCPL